MNTSNTGEFFKSLHIFLIVVVLTVVWCLVFLLVFTIWLFFLKNQQERMTQLQSTTEYEVPENIKKREKNRSFRERVNSVYYEWIADPDYCPQRKPDSNASTVEMTGLV